MPDGDVEKTAIVGCFVAALRVLWIATAAVAAAGLVLSFWVKGLSLDREFETDQGLRDVWEKREKEGGGLP